MSGVTDAGLEHLQDLRKLEHLDLQGTAVTGDGFAYLARLPQLRAINLSGDHITDASMEQLKALSGLEELLLAYPRVTDEGVVHIATLPRLRRLHVRSGRITDTGLEALKQASQLELLQISSSPRVSQGARLDLRTSLPQLQLFSDGADLP